MNKLVDCFLFFNELELLEIRLYSLRKYVDRFVLCESPVTHTGNPKRLYFEENKGRFDKFNITHLVVDNYQQFLGLDPLLMEGNQRNFLINGIKDEDPESIILISDVDEIPNLRSYTGGDGVFRQRLYYYAFNVYTGNRKWMGTVAIKRKNINGPLDSIRDKIADQCKLEMGKEWGMNTVAYHGGWHFSMLGPPERVTYLIESFCCQRYNTPEIKMKVAENMENLEDLFGRSTNPLRIEMPTGPKWLLRRKRRYKHLFYDGNGKTNGQA